jgi:hypothetical protein
VGVEGCVAVGFGCCVAESVFEGEVSEVVEMIKGLL